MFKRKKAVCRLISSILGTALIMGNMLVMPAAAMDLNDVGSAPSAVVEETPSSNGNGGTDYVTEETFQTLYGDTTISPEEAEKTS